MGWADGVPKGIWLGFKGTLTPAAGPLEPRSPCQRVGGSGGSRMQETLGGDSVETHFSPRVYLEADGILERRVRCPGRLLWGPKYRLPSFWEGGGLRKKPPSPVLC